MTKKLTFNLSQTINMERETHSKNSVAIQSNEKLGILAIQRKYEHDTEEMQSRENNRSMNFFLESRTVIEQFLLHNLISQSLVDTFNFNTIKKEVEEEYQLSKNSNKSFRLGLFDKNIQVFAYYLYFSMRVTDMRAEITAEIKDISSRLRIRTKMKRASIINLAREKGISVDRYMELTSQLKRWTEAMVEKSKSLTVYGRKDLAFALIYSSITKAFFTKSQNAKGVMAELNYRFSFTKEFMTALPYHVEEFFLLCKRLPSIQKNVPEARFMLRSFVLEDIPTLTPGQEVVLVDGYLEGTTFKVDMEDLLNPDKAIYADEAIFTYFTVGRMTATLEDFSILKDGTSIVFKVTDLKTAQG